MYFDRTKKQNGYIFKPLSMKESAKKRLRELPREDILPITSTFNRLLEQNTLINNGNKLIVAIKPETKRMKFP